MRGAGRRRPGRTPDPQRTSCRHGLGATDSMVSPSGPAAGRGEVAVLEHSADVCHPVAEVLGPRPGKGSSSGRRHAPADRAGAPHGLIGPRSDRCSVFGVGVRTTTIRSPGRLRSPSPLPGGSPRARGPPGARSRWRPRRRRHRKWENPVLGQSDVVGAALGAYGRPDPSVMVLAPRSRRGPHRCGLTGGVDPMAASGQTLRGPRPGAGRARGNRDG